jgi:ATP-dependent Clp protease ATP-binding subunit ClpX
MRSLDRREGKLLSPREIYEYLDRFVIGQERAKRVVAIAAHNHLRRVGARARGLLRKSNLLLIGPTGSGKTHIARNLADCLGVAFTVADATEYTEAGYYGKDVEVMVAELLFKTQHSIEETQRGIIFIDEVDKIARRGQGARTGAGSRDIGGEGVQQALLKLLEGREIFVPLNVTQHWNKHDFVQVDTTDILFVCAGTFSDIHAYGDERPVGFGRQAAERSGRAIGVRDLLDYGMLAEFLGRLPVMVTLGALSEDELLRVLTEPPDAVVREYRHLLSLSGVELSFTEGAMREVVRFSMRKGAGARGLRGIVEEVLHDLMFEAPERAGRTVEIDAAYVRERLGRLEELVL